MVFVHSSFREKHSSQIRAEHDTTTEARKARGWHEIGMHAAIPWTRAALCYRLVCEAVPTPEHRSTRRIEWPIKNKKSSRCGRSLLTKWAFRSVSLFPVILRGYGAEHCRDNALRKDRNEYKDRVVLRKSNRDRYESKEKSLMRHSEICVKHENRRSYNIKYLSVVNVAFFYTYILTYTYIHTCIYVYVCIYTRVFLRNKNTKRFFCTSISYFITLYVTTTAS